MGVLIAGLAVLQVPFILRGDYSQKPVWRMTSIDGRYRLEISRRATFPAYDILDPVGTAYFTVVDNRTGEPVARAAEHLYELFDLKRPAVEWAPTHVHVADFDESRPAAVVRLTLPQ